MNLSLQSVASGLGGEICGPEVLAPGPGHSPKDRSLSVKLDHNGQILVHSFCSDNWRECRDYVLRKLGLNGPEMAVTRPYARRQAVTLAAGRMPPMRPAFGVRPSMCGARWPKRTFAAEV
jgi:hypothetical protein